MNEMTLFDEGAGMARLVALKSRHNLLVQATKEVLSDGLDYGKIPGTGDKPTLLKPGAEKLCFLFGLRPTFEVVQSVEDWERGLFYYRYRCTLHDAAGGVIADGEGSCNSREKKYRYRSVERTCPECGKETIKRSKFPPRDQPNAQPGWYCYAKIGGCGANFAAEDIRIAEQESGQIENTEPYDLINTLQKMAQKRALIAAVLVGTGASQFFTQDVEDMQVIDMPSEPVVRHPTAQPEQAPAPETPPAPKPRVIKLDKATEDNGVPTDTWFRLFKYVQDHLPAYADLNDVVETLRAALNEAEDWKPWTSKGNINGDPAVFWGVLEAHATGKEFAYPQKEE